MRPLRMSIFCILCLLSALPLACSDDTSSPRDKPDSHTYVLQATDANGIVIDIAANTRARITAEDTVSTNPDGPVVDCDFWTDADGIATCNYVWTEYMCRGLPFMALIGTCGADSFLVGTSFDSTFTGAVQLNLLVNDWVHTDNDGFFTITVILE